MSWFPIGPDFVFAPRDANFLRLSRRNEGGRQGLVSNIAVDPTDPTSIYVVLRPTSGGTTAFRTQNDGATYEPIADSLQQTNPNIDPSCIAINPANPNIIYMGTYGDSAVYVSNSRGDAGSWGPRNPALGNVRKIIVDPNTASNPATTVLYAATNTGVQRSSNGGTTWNTVLYGDVWSLVTYIPSTGTSHFYAGVFETGVFHATDPTAAWQNLNTRGIGLPAHSGSTLQNPNGNFDVVLVDLCPLNPSRVYAWMVFNSCDVNGQNCNEVTANLFTTGSPLTAWTQVNMTSPPGPAYGWYDLGFVVAPNSPGDGNNDILFFESIFLSRSVDGGKTWKGEAVGYHADQHAMVYFPANPPAGVVPAMYVGTDGGITMSTKYADPTFDISVDPGYYDEGQTYADSGVWQNYDHGMQSPALYAYNSHPAISALGYIGCQDTGVAGGTGAFGWRSLIDADSGAIATSPGSDGVKVWGINGAYNSWPGFRIFMWTDNGGIYPPGMNPTLGAGGSLLAGTSNYIVGLDNSCLAGVVVRDSDRTLSTAITATGSQIATPSSMANIAVGTILTIDSGNNQENVTVTGTTATTFTASFGKTHLTGVTIQLNRSLVVRIDRTGIASQISQDFGLNGVQVNIVAPSPLNKDILYCATNDQRLWTTNVGSTANSSTVWTEISGNKPIFSSGMASIALDNAGNVFVLFQASLNAGGVTSPLFQISGGNWVLQPCSGLPTGFNFGKLLADPVQPNTLYASNGARVYQASLFEGTWAWTDISSNLPGQWIYDMWIGNIAPTGPAKVILRAAIPTRGVWETDVTAGAPNPTVALYVRDNFLDQGWLNPSPDGFPNPYDPSNPGATLYHYMCADLKVDAQQQGTGGAANFFQTDPEGSTLPIPRVLFDQLRDNSENLPSSDQAMVHVQVRNRSLTPANGVRVWVAYANAGAGLPGLNESPSQGNNFPFWNQFTVTGQIIPNLPGDSPWKSVGPPQLLPPVDAMHPQVASWSWTIPTLPSGDPGHFCMAVFIHSGASPVNETGMNLDDVTPRNPQIGQKNLHIGPPLPPQPGPGGGGGGGGVPGGVRMQEYVEFHNPTPVMRQGSLVLELRGLPPQLRVSFQLTPLITVNPLASSITGIASAHTPGVIATLWSWLGELFWCVGRILERIGCWIENLGRWLLGLPRKSCKQPPAIKEPHFAPTIYEASPSAFVEIKGVQLKPYEFCAAKLNIQNTGGLPEGSQYTFHIQQQVSGTVVGGAMYVVRIAGNLKFTLPPLALTIQPNVDVIEASDVDGAADDFRYVPPWAADIVAAAEKAAGKK